MEILRRSSEVPGITLIALDGGLDHTTTALFISQMDGLLEEGVARVVVDLGHLSYASSWGLAAMVRVHHHFVARGGKIAFANLHSGIATILRLSHLDRLFDLFPTVQEAVRAIAPKPEAGPASAAEKPVK